MCEADPFFKGCKKCISTNEKVVRTPDFEL